MRWIGGGSGAGKSTFAKRLVNAQGATLYDTDRMMGEHTARCSAERCPNLAVFTDMSMDERWVRRTPVAMLDSFHWFEGEGFDLIVEDLLSMPRDVPVIVEGFRLLPRLVAPLLADRRNALWLLPTPAFRQHAFDRRGTTWDIPRRTSDPERALANLLERDALFTERLRIEASKFDLRSLEVDGALPGDALTDIIEKQFFQQNR